MLKTQGRRGEVAVELHSDSPGRLRPGLRLFALAEDGTRREQKIEDSWPHRRHLVLKFAGVDSISAAEALVGNELQVPASERAPLEPGATYVSDLIGCRVFDRGHELGWVREVRFGAGEAPLLVLGSGRGELEIPYAREFLAGINLDERRIDMTLPEGMLEVNAPLTEEEKRVLNSSHTGGRRRRGEPL